MIKIITDEIMGRCLVAERPIPAGMVIMQCELLVLSEVDTPLVNETDLKYYTFKFNETQDCLVLGLGEIFNHRSAPNVSYELVDIGDRKVMQFSVIADIWTDDQLFIDYNADVQVNTEGYINTKSLVG